MVKTSAPASPPFDEASLAQPSSVPGTTLHVLKHADTFVVCDAYGDIVGHGAAHEDQLRPEGMFHDDTRILSHYVLTLNGQRPRLLGSHVSRDNVLLVVDLTNDPMSVGPKESVPGSILHVRRSRFLWVGRLREELRLRNYGLQPLRLSLALEFGADFRDLFEVRGMRRGERGERIDDQVDGEALALGYLGRDSRERLAWIELSMPATIEGRSARFELTLEPQSETFLLVSISVERLGARPERRAHRQAAAAARRAMRGQMRRGARLSTSNPLFDAWVHRARADLALLITDHDTGPFPYAGIPWFSTAFGRDAIITALEVLWLDPALARGVLGYLAARQATEISAFHDAEPGKIMHESRKGEMALLGEVPFLAYFGGVDTTPLFIMLAGAYVERTADLEFIATIWPTLEKALAWIDDYGDLDGDGFVEYQRRADTGLANQGWKDSYDAVFHADGRDAEGPIALCEVQGYVFAAKQAAARIAEALGDAERAALLREQAVCLRKQFEEYFWNDAIGGYALALDGAKRPCLVQSSNMGHLLYCGIAAPERAAAVARQLLGPHVFSGWGVRTIARHEARYNPMSYHNGSVWPHDTALVAAGLGRYGMRKQAGHLLQAQFDAAAAFGDFRLPELFCGFQRRAGEHPTAYPVACLPQAWASGAVFLLLNACLGLKVDAAAGKIIVDQPFLPAILRELKIENLQIGSAQASVHFVLDGEQVAVRLLETNRAVSLEIKNAS